MEKKNIQTMLDGKENCPAMVEADRVTEVGDRHSIEQILCSRDQIIGLQGGAGTGKTTALSQGRLYQHRLARSAVGLYFQ